MKNTARKLTLCALLGASMNAQAVFVPFLDGEFTSGQGDWGQTGPATFTYPPSDGNPGGYGVMDASTGWGVWVTNNNTTAVPLSTYGLVAGNGYTFKMDMRIEAGSVGSNLGKLKLEWDGGPGGIYGPSQPTIIDNNWNTYTWDVIIPAGVTGLKVVPVNENGSKVGFDNIGFESVPYYIAPPPPAPPSDVVVLDTFTAASSRWGVPTFNGTGISGSVEWSSTEGNSPGSTILTATNPVPAGGNGFYTYTATGVDFGDGPVEISFDVKGTVPFSGFHVTYNGNQVFDLQNQGLNGATYTTFKRTFELTQGFDATDTFTLQFQIAMGPVVGSGGTLSIDNIVVKTNLPTASTPFAAAITPGKAVSWVPPNPGNAYQPQKSADGVIYNDLGPLVLGDGQTSVFDESGAQSYKVLESEPFSQDVVYDGGFLDDLSLAWLTFQSQAPVYQATGGRGDDGGCMQFLVDNTATVGPNGSELQQNTANAYFNETLDAAPGTVIPGQTYSFEFWAKQISSANGYVQNYSIQFLADGGAVLLNSGALSFVPPVGGDWTKFTTSMVAPAGATSAFIQIVASTGADAIGHGEVLIDDVSLVTTGFTPVGELPATSASAVAITWQSALGKNYQVQSSGDLGTWADFGGVLAGDGSIMAVYDSMVDPKKFYKVGVVAELP